VARIPIPIIEETATVRPAFKKAGASADFNRGIDRGECPLTWFIKEAMYEYFLGKVST
jgi:hypothetical protein